MNDKAAKLDESVFKSIEFERLTDRDRAVVERRKHELKHWFDLLASDDPEILRDAAWRMSLSAFALGARTHVSDSAKKFLDIKRDGAKGRKSAITRRKKMQEWQDHVRNKLPELRRKNPTLTPNGLAEYIRSKSTLVSLPCHERLVQFIRATLKA